MPRPPFRRRWFAVLAVAVGAVLGLVRLRAASARGAAFAAPKTVLITGASGRTGRLIVEKLLKREGFNVRAFVRSEDARQDLLKFAPTLKKEQVFIGDILAPATLAPALAGCNALVIVTSAVPRIRLFSLAKTLLARLIGKRLRPKFRWKAGLKPEQVDWEGQRNQVDAALAAGVSRIVLVGSMGGTQPDNFLNSIGEGEGDKILLWKRKAETYLIERCKAEGGRYTIVHPGGLLDAPGGERRLVLGLDDELLERPVKSIPRADVAELCVQALECKDALDRSFDVCADALPADGKAEGALEPGGGQLPELLGTLGGKNCGYGSPVLP